MIYPTFVSSFYLVYIRVSHPPTNKLQYVCNYYVYTDLIEAGGVLKAPASDQSHLLLNDPYRTQEVV